MSARPKPRVRLRYDFQSDRPIEFDIHYHDGLTIRFPVKMSGVASHEAEFDPDKSQSYCLMWLNSGLEETSLKYRVVGPYEAGVGP